MHHLAKVLGGPGCTDIARICKKLDKVYKQHSFRIKHVISRLTLLLCLSIIHGRLIRLAYPRDYNLNGHTNPFPFCSWLCATVARIWHILAEMLVITMSHTSHHDTKYAFWIMLLDAGLWLYSPTSGRMIAVGLSVKQLVLWQLVTQENSWNRDIL